MPTDQRYRAACPSLLRTLDQVSAWLRKATTSPQRGGAQPQLPVTSPRFGCRVQRPVAGSTVCTASFAFRFGCLRPANAYLVISGTIVAACHRLLAHRLG